MSVTSPLEVIAVRGDVDFVHDGTSSGTKCWRALLRLLPTSDQVASGNGTVDADWDDWNGERDELWEQRLQHRGHSVDYLPEPIRDESYALEENGSGSASIMRAIIATCGGRPGSNRGWRPFTAGRWTVYYGDNCWIPDEPFGYVTHHYGSWVYVESSRAWYWMPPVARCCPRHPWISPSASAGIRAGSAGSTAVLPSAGCRLRRTSTIMATGLGAIAPWLSDRTLSSTSTFPLSLSR